jgi:hypothetical protein
MSKRQASSRNVINEDATPPGLLLQEKIMKSPFYMLIFSHFEVSDVVHSCCVSAMFKQMDDSDEWWEAFCQQTSPLFGHLKEQTGLSWKTTFVKRETAKSGIQVPAMHFPCRLSFVPRAAPPIDNPTPPLSTFASPQGLGAMRLLQSRFKVFCVWI